MMELTSLVAAILVPIQTNFPAIPPKAAAALAVGLAAFGAGYAERGIGAAAVGAVAEDDEMFGRGLILTVLPETLVILALVVVFVVPEVPYESFV
ncbi:F0F1 ATP synthase subunit C [Salinirubellus salinus]|uniref:F0F1 ATP synthase subunit C n=1 Tax=Salinirubellus salinus TaxID=1364945 RepID=A0A9E7U6Y3_9EURY|nr:F0F1 ATP synthase subunit C [Salinirubellus salinus]UWM52906.1 F0F1 ATP synthase subunit C [Salinirubellus salinus]